LGGLRDGPLFSGEHASFIDGFEPKGGEAVISKSQISPYANKTFKETMLSAKGNEILIAGYGSTMCCLSTVVSGSAFGLRHSFVHDASWARALSETMPEANSHRYATAIIGIHGKIRTTASVLAM
jgi:ureidoacrylate peracid hydrolase